MSKELGITVKKNEDLSEWYTQVVMKADLADYAGMKGFMVLKPYGYAVWEKIRDYLDRRFKETGHVNAYFPALIPESYLRKEAEHFAGFNPEVFWVTHAGDERLAERLAIRPTSETIIYESYSKWVRSWRDLPILINVWNSVLRAEIKATKPFLRTSEFLWQEGHTVHATKEEADQEVMQQLMAYKDLVEEQLAIPTLVGVKTEREKFVGALYTTTLEAIMPDGKALQMGTSHNLGQNFSKPFEIKYLGKDEQVRYAWTTSWGVSWRLIGAVVMAHGDDRGLILPPRIAPVQAIIVPIFYKGKDKEKVLKKSERVCEKLKRAGVTAHIDAREQYTPGWKFHEWELKGVPLRLEIGPRDVEQRQVTAVRRDTLERQVLKDQRLAMKVKALLEEVQRSLFEKAQRMLRDYISQTGSFDEFKRILDERGGFIKACWCSKTSCEDKIKQETGATIRLIPLDPEQVFSGCIYCGDVADKVVYFARAY